MKRAATYLEFFVQDIVGRKIESKDYYSDFEVLAIIDSDSDMLVTVEKADIVEVLDEDSSTLVGFEEIFK